INLLKSHIFPSGLQAGGSTGLLMDLAANEKAVHADFFNGKDFFHLFKLSVE
uniref:COP9 signalosome complex subunit 9 n=1 Tax=Seriola lalandi dorsalis TaxID=1841481 RepID=A0A3B4XEB5_SERLL